MTSAEATAYLNQLYTGFDDADDTTPLGVTISMAAQDTAFFKNQYCSLFVNPDSGESTGCFNGQADCRMSASLLSNKWMLDSQTGNVASFGHRSVGYVFNQTLVETRWTKCSYVWDGASGNRYNRGCGDGAPGNSCDEGSGSAWFNICPSTGKTCTGGDIEVTRSICSVAGGALPVPPTHDGEAQCVFPGVALNYHSQEEFTAGRDYTREMAKQRLKYNDGHDATGKNLEKNNEVVLDEELLIPDFWEDPVAAIPAFIYTKSNMPISRNHAQMVRDDFCRHQYCEQNGGGLIPLVMVDDQTYHKEGPFVADGEEESAVVV